MAPNQAGGGKLPGKTRYAGRRRAMTRKSGFKVHKETSGGEFQRLKESTISLNAGDSVKVTFRISGHKAGDLIGYGLWFWHGPGVSQTITGGPTRKTQTAFNGSAWNKAGSIWVAETASAVSILFSLTARTESTVAIYSPICGRIRHKHLDRARPALMRNMYQFAPEALFINSDDSGSVTRSGGRSLIKTKTLILKSCNRCGRYLPINVPNERDQLSFSNHCVAKHRLPCSHTGFGHLHNVDNVSDELDLKYGFQLECRFCKKFEVNAAHNPQRTAAQMKEDGARRRAFELLLENLYEGTPQLRYRHEHNRELTNTIWEQFERKCFNCNVPLQSPKDMQLDHTRPLSLLWPLDGTATALCKSCNSEKRDRSPASFYKKRGQLSALSKITGIGLSELKAEKPNEEAIKLLLERKEWFFRNFLTREEMTKERAGKITGELVVKALQKVLASSKKYKEIDLLGEYEKRRNGW